MLPVARLEGLSFGSGRRGFAALEVLVPASRREAFRLQEGVRMADVVVRSHAGRRVWRGRVEDAKVVARGLQIGAFGYARAYEDVPYTALWSQTGSRGWRPVTSDELAIAKTERFEVDNNNRVRLAIKKNEQSNTSNLGVMVYELPDGGEREAVTIAFSYTMTTTTGNTYWMVLRGYDDSWTQIDSSTVASTTTTASGSHSFTFSAGVTKVAILFGRNSGTLHTYTGDTGATFAKATAIRLKTTATATVGAGEIAVALTGFVAGINPSQVVEGDVFVGAGVVDLQDEVYEDERPADILDRLAEGENFDWAVWDDLRLNFGARGTGGRALVVDVAELELEQSIEPVVNRAYAVYKTASGRRLRTAVADNELSQGRVGVVRMGFVESETTSGTEAAAARDALLTERGSYAIRADVFFRRIYTETGAEVPLEEVRAGDTVTMRNLPPTLAADVDNLRTFRVAATTFRAKGRVLLVEADVPVPTLITLVAKGGTGRRDGGTGRR